jgi:hypothetical protein
MEQSECQYGWRRFRTSNAAICAYLWIAVQTVPLHYSNHSGCQVSIHSERNKETLSWVVGLEARLSPTFTHRLFSQDRRPRYLQPGSSALTGQARNVLVVADQSSADSRCQHVVSQYLQAVYRVNCLVSDQFSHQRVPNAWLEGIWFVQHRLRPWRL